MFSGPIYQSSCRSFEEEEEVEDEDDEITVLPISVPDSDGPILATLGYFYKRPLQKQ